MENSDLAVYLACYNEDLTIIPAWKALSKVFHQVKVVDVGSTDSSIYKLKKVNADIIQIPVMTDENLIKTWSHSKKSPYEAYTAVKNHYAEQHEWIFWVDGDEVWPEAELQKIVPAINTGEYGAYRVGNKFATEDNTGKFLYDNFVIAEAPRVFRGDIYKWNRRYPDEYLMNKLDGDFKKGIQPKYDDTVDPSGVKSRKQIYSFWNWHLRYMKRSSTMEIRLRNDRRKNTLHWLDEFDKIRVNKFPWDE